MTNHDQTAAQTSLVQKARKALDSFLASTPAKIAFSMVVGLVLFLSGLTYPASGADDSWSMMVALSGRQPGGGLCLFINALLCNIIFGLNTMLPALNWFYIIETLCSYSAFVAIVYLCLSHARPAIGAVLIAGTVRLSLRYCTFSDNFTVISFICICAGGLMLIARIADSEEKHPFYAVFGVLLMVFGFMWRFETFLLSLPFFAIPAVIALRSSLAGITGGSAALHKTSESRLSKAGALLCPWLVAFALCGGLAAYDAAAWSQPGWSDWKEFDDARSTILDYPMKTYDEAQDYFESIGVSRNDFEFVEYWESEDPDFITTERMQEIAGASAQTDLTPATFAESAVSYVSSLEDAGMLYLAIVVFVIAAIFASLKGSRRVWAFIILFLGLCCCIAFLAIGRLPRRVEVPIWLFSIAGMTALSFEPSPIRPAGAHARIAAVNPARSGPVANVVSAICVAFACFTCLSFIEFSPPDEAAEMLTARYSATAQPQDGAIITYVQNHPDTLFVWDVGDYAVLEDEYQLRYTPDADTLARSIQIGGWLARAPFTLASNESVGVTNPVRALVEDDRVVFVTSSPYVKDITLKYLQEHYYPDASAEKVDEIISESGDPIGVYRFSDTES